MYQEDSMSPKRLIAIIATAVIVVIFGLSSFQLFENLDTDYIMVIQHPISGELTWYKDAGLKWQGFGKVTVYPKRAQFWFSASKDQGVNDDQSIKMRFNDGAHGWASGSLSYEMPMNDSLLTVLHQLYGSSLAIEHELIRTVVEKSVYMTGPLLSSKEAYAERRNDLIRWIDDQILHGVYKTQTKNIQDKDPMTGAPRTISVVEVVEKNGLVVRQDESPIERFKLKITNLSLNAITFEERVENQITEQQRAIQQVQIAIAKAKEAEQAAITAEKEGQALAAKAKWEQEVKKAQAVTEAQQKLEVASLEVKTAAQYKAKRILEAEADAEYKRKIIVADGALTQKLDTYEKVMGKFAENIGKQKWVPDIQFGGSGVGSNSNAAQSLMEMFGAKIAKDLALDLKVKQ